MISKEREGNKKALSPRRPPRPNGAVGLGRRGNTRRQLAAELVEHVIDGFDQLGALLDQSVATLGKRRMDRSGYRGYLVPLRNGVASHAKRAAPERRLDYQHAAAQAGYQVAAAGEMGGLRRGAGRKLRQQTAATGKLCGQRAQGRGVDAIEPARDRRHAAAGRGQATALGGGVDAAGEPAEDGPAGRRQGFGERLRVADSLRGGVAAADDGDRRAVEQLAPADVVEDRRRGRRGK